MNKETNKPQKATTTTKRKKRKNKGVCACFFVHHVEIVKMKRELKIVICLCLESILILFPNLKDSSLDANCTKILNDVHKNKTND